MTNEEMVAANEFCISHNVEISFLNSLNESGLLETTTMRKLFLLAMISYRNWKSWSVFIMKWILTSKVLKTIHHLLQQMKAMQDEIRTIKNRLSLYEKIEL